jgi:hypothetical protein
VQAVTNRNKVLLETADHTSKKTYSYLHHWCAHGDLQEILHVGGQGCTPPPEATHSPPFKPKPARLNTAALANNRSSHTVSLYTTYIDQIHNLLIKYKKDMETTYLHHGCAHGHLQEVLHVGGQGRPPRHQELHVATQPLLHLLEHQAVKEGSGLKGEGQPAAAAADM